MSDNRFEWLHAEDDDVKVQFLIDECVKLEKRVRELEILLEIYAEQLQQHVLRMSVTKVELDP